MLCKVLSDLNSKAYQDGYNLGMLLMKMLLTGAVLKHKWLIWRGLGLEGKLLRLLV
jgi:hypothetical protein